MPTDVKVVEAVTCAGHAMAYAGAMPLWKRLGFLLVFVVPALMPAAAWLGARSGQRRCRYQAGYADGTC